MICRFIFFFLTISVYSQSVKNQDDIKWLEFNNQEHLSTPDGCIIDDDGFVFISTAMGIYCYDGKDLTILTDEKYPDINKSRIFRLSKGADGCVYFFTYPYNFLYRIKKKKIQRILYKKGVRLFINTLENNKHIEVKSLSIKKSLLLNRDPNFNSDLFIKNSSLGAISMFENKKFIYFQMFDKLFIFYKSLPSRSKVIKYSIHNFIFQFNNRLFSFEDKTIKEIIGDRIVASNNFKTDFIFDKILKNSDVNYTLHSKILIDNLGSAYFVYKNSVYQLQFVNGLFYSKFIFKSEDEDLNSIQYSKENDIYFVTSPKSGFGYYKKSKFITITNPNTNLPSYEYTVYPLDNEHYFSPSGWLYSKVSKNSFEIKKWNFAFTNKTFILKYNDNIYYQIFSDIVNVKNPNEKIFKEIKSKTNLLVDYCFLNNRLWLTQANPDALLFYENKGKLIVDDFITNYFKGFLINKLLPFNNKLIIATNHGVYVYYPHKKKIFWIKGLKNIYSRNFIKNDNTSFWVCSYGSGLFLVKNLNVYKVNDENFELSNAHSIEIDNKGSVWVSTNEGLLTINKKSLIEKTLSNKKVDFYRYTTDDGLLSNEFNGGSTNPSFKDSEGYIGFANMAGVVYFNPKFTKKNIFKKDIIIDQVSSDKVNIKQKSDYYYIPNDIDYLNIEFSFPYYYNRRNLSVEYSVNNNNWQEINNNKIVLLRERKGECNIFIRIKTNSVSNEKSVLKKVKLIFEPRFYERIWFWIVVFLFLILIMLAMFKVGLLLNKRKQKMLEEKVKLKTFELENANLELTKSKEVISKSLEEKELLLKEIHHRVKNNLQLVISLLNIQSRRNNYQTIEDFLENGQTRIKSMVLIYENLYQNESIERLNVQEYTESLTNTILESFNVVEDEIKITVKANGVKFNLQTAIPYGLIVNEFVTNSIKYAFPKESKGEIFIGIKSISPDEFELCLSDNGIGFEINNLKKKSFGIELIKLLSNQLNGNLTIDTNGQTRFHLIFKPTLV